MCELVGGREFGRGRDYRITLFFAISKVKRKLGMQVRGGRLQTGGKQCMGLLGGY